MEKVLMNVKMKKAGMFVLRVLFTMALMFGVVYAIEGFHMEQINMVRLCSVGVASILASMIDFKSIIK